MNDIKSEMIRDIIGHLRNESEGARINFLRGIIYILKSAKIDVTNLITKVEEIFNISLEDLEK